MITANIMVANIRSSSEEQFPVMMNNSSKNETRKIFQRNMSKKIKQNRKLKDLDLTHRISRLLKS